MILHKSKLLGDNNAQGSSSTIQMNPINFCYPHPWGWTGQLPTCAHANCWPCFGSQCSGCHSCLENLYFIYSLYDYFPAVSLSYSSRFAINCKIHSSRGVAKSAGVKRKLWVAWTFLINNLQGSDSYVMDGLSLSISHWGPDKVLWEWAAKTVMLTLPTSEKQADSTWSKAELCWHRHLNGVSVLVSEKHWCMLGCSKINNIL